MSPNDAVEEAKKELVECEKEINLIKSSVRLLVGGTPGSTDAGTNNLSIVALKIDGLPETAKPKLALQLSSPVEEAFITAIFDPSVEEQAEGATASFSGVQAGQATLTVTASDVDIPLGTSDALDVGEMAKFDPMSSNKTFESEITVPIKPEGQTAGEPVCTVVCRATFTPSETEKREQLYDLLGVATKKKSAIVEKLRKAAIKSVSNQMETASPSNPAWKSGFLNEDKKEPSKLQVWYQRYLGPGSFVRRAFPIAKNYLLFFGVVTFFHFKGHWLALPPPV